MSNWLLPRSLELVGLLVATMASILLVGCSSGPGGPDGDTTPPTVSAVLPAAGAIDVATDAQVSISFSEAIAIGSVNAGTVTFSPSLSGQFDTDSNEVQFIPASSLAYATEYEVTVTNGITDLAGNHLKLPFVWGFTVEADPATTVPQVASTVPVANATGVDASAAVSVVFTKGMDPSTLTTSSFVLNPVVAGAVSGVGNSATFTPDDTMAFNTRYTATVTTAAADTFGNHFPANYSWSFTTGNDPYIPRAYVVYPYYDAIVGNSTTILVVTQHPVGVERVEFYVDGVYQTGGDDYSAPFEYLWDASGSVIGSEHLVTARAYDAQDRMGHADTIPVIYQWAEIATDANDDQRADIFRVFARSSDSTLEFRYEFWENWSDPTADTALDLGIFLDTDLNGTTGFTRLSDGTWVNDIGAEYRIIIGLHGNTALSHVAADNTTWISLGGPEVLSYYNVPADTNILEFGVRWSDIDDPSAVHMVSNNVFFITTSTLLRDWVPNLGSGHLSVLHSDRYIGETASQTETKLSRAVRANSMEWPQPFD